MPKYKQPKYVFDNVEICQIRYSSCLIYKRTFKFSATTGKEIPLDKKNNSALTQNFKQKPTYSGTVSTHVKKRIQKAVDLFLQLSPKRILFNPVTQNSYPFQLSFITLTISNNDFTIPGKQAYELLLKPFIQWLTKTKKVSTYIWKAEMQKRGQIHYHITLNQFIHFKEIQEKWNYLQRKNNLLDMYYLNNSHYNPNSTDVHSVKNIKNISGYLTKYLSKTGSESFEETYYNSKEVVLVDEVYEGNILSCYPACEFHRYEIGGKTWDCSDNLRGKKFYDMMIDSKAGSMLDIIKADKRTREFKNEYCTMFFSTDGRFVDLLSDRQMNDYKQHIQYEKSNSFAD